MRNKRIIIMLMVFPVILFCLSQCITVAPLGPESETKDQNNVQKDPDVVDDPEKIEPENDKVENPGKVTARSNKFSSNGASGIARLHAKSDTPGGRVLKTAITMVAEKEIILGSCWTFVNEVYDRAGYTSEKRKTIYKEDKEGPYIDPALLLPGDWISYRNLPYNEIGHSAIFVEWINYERRSALTIEYVGGNRKIPGRYREADIYKTYGLFRGDSE